MLFHLPKIRSYAQSEFNQAGSTGFVTDAELDDWANEGYIKYCVRIMMAHQGYFEVSTLLSTVAGTETVALPSNFLNAPSALNVVRLEKIMSNSTVPCNYNRRSSIANQTSGGVTGLSYVPSYDFRGNNLVLEPTPMETSANCFKLIYQGLPPRLHSGTAQAGGATTITLSTDADPRDDYYNGSSVYIVSGTGVGQIRMITDYVGLTRVATVATWTSNPGVTSVYSTLMHPDFPEQFHEMIPLYAAKKAFLKERARGTVTTYDDSDLKELEAQFVEFTEERTEARKFVQPWHPESF